MTKQQAIEIDLEKEYGKIFSDAIGEKCLVSVMKGRMRIYIGNNYINFGGDDFETPLYLKFHGGYDELQDCIIKIRLAIRQNKEKIKLLMQLYKEA